MKLAGLELDDEELECLIFLGLDKPERARLAHVGVLPHDGSCARLAVKGLVVQIEVDPRHYESEAGNLLATNARGGIALVELTASGRKALMQLGSTRRAAVA